MGAGPTGLGAAWRLSELARRQVLNPATDWLLTEQAPVPGGMAASENDAQGFTWDLGGHVVYSHYRYFDAMLDELLSGQLFWHERKGWVWMNGRFIPFPIQHNLHHLPADQLAPCLRDLLAACGNGTHHARNGMPATFAEWLEANFGAALCRLFFLPYNQKMWAHSAHEMSTGWTQRKSGSRYANVPLVDLQRLMDNVVSRADDPGWAGATPFPYPQRGGMGVLWQRLFDRLPRQLTALRERLVAVDPQRCTATFASGLQVAYRHMISSVPLPELLAAMPQGSELHRARSPLRHSHCHVMGVGVRGPLPDALRDKYWIHVPDPALPFFRITIVSNYSRHNVPEDGEHWSLICEASESPAFPADAGTLPASVERALRGPFVPEDQQIVSRWHRRLHYGYPVPCLARDAFLNEVEPRLRRHNIRTRGRFGGWKYETSNQDNGFMQGVEAVDSILLGTEEISYFYPDLISEGAVQRILPN